MIISHVQNRIGALALGAVLALPLAGCSSDDTASSTSGVRYLGLGDSIAYGENGFVPYTAEARPNGDAFVGYPDLLGREVFDDHYANLGCPGATTNSFSSLDGEDNGCRDFQANWLNTLHVPYTTTEADKAEEILAMNDLQAVTLSIGGNDLLVTL
jgi:GDSL-like Lipase/Acylhydrolase family